MKDSSYQTVCDALCRRLGIANTRFLPALHLDDDLHLDALDRDLVALWLEDTEDVEIGAEAMQSAKTVGQLVGILRSLKREHELAARAESAQRFSHWVGVVAQRGTRARTRASRASRASQQAARGPSLRPARDRRPSRSTGCSFDQARS